MAPSLIHARPASWAKGALLHCLDLGMDALQGCCSCHTLGHWLIQGTKYALLHALRLSIGLIREGWRHTLGHWLIQGTKYVLLLALRLSIGLIREGWRHTLGPHILENTLAY